jgi:hypothetical protein
MTTATIVWLYLAAAGILACWVMLRFPTVRPRSIPGACALFVAGQVAPLLGLLALPVVLAAANGVRLALVMVVLPSFFVASLTLGWFLWAVVDSVRAPRRKSVGLN